MSKKDFVLIAKALHDAHKAQVELTKKKRLRGAAKAVQQINVQMAYVRETLAQAMKVANPRFNADLFHDAATYSNQNPQ